MPVVNLSRLLLKKVQWQPALPSVQWSGTPSPTFLTTTTTPYSLTSFIANYNVATDVISLAPGSANLPTGITLTSNQLVPSGTQAAANTTGIVFRVTRAGVGTADSASVTISVGPVVSWSSTPNPVFVQGATTPFSLASYINSYSVSTDVVSLAPGSASLPSWLSLTANQLVPNGTQVDANDFSGLLLRVTRTINGVATADTGSITVTVTTNSLQFNTPSPTFTSGVPDSYNLASFIPGFTEATDTVSIAAGNPGWLEIAGSELRADGTQTTGFSGLYLRVVRVGVANPVDTVSLTVAVTANTVGWKSTPTLRFKAGYDYDHFIHPFVKFYNSATDVITLAPDSAALPAWLTYNQSLARLRPDGSQTVGSSFTGLKFQVSRSGGAQVSTGPITVTVSLDGVQYFGATPSVSFAHKSYMVREIYPYFGVQYSAGIDVISLSPYSAPLPPWLTISNNQLIANGTQTSDQTVHGIMLRVTRGAGTPSDSAMFSIEVTAEEVYAPAEIQLTQDPTYILTTQGDASAVLDFGKHVQLETVGDGSIVAFGGDCEGVGRLPLNGYTNLGESGFNLSAPIRLNMNTGGTMTQLVNAFGNLADGTAPFMHDGCTFVYVASDNKFIAMPGQQGDYSGSNAALYDPLGIKGAHIGHVHYLYESAGTWHWSAGRNIRSGSPVWPNEHWGGAYYEGLVGETGIKRSVYMQGGNVGTYGTLMRFDIDSEVIEAIAILQTPGLELWSGIGYELVSNIWPQVMIGPILYVYDGYRGHIIGIDVRTRPNPTPFIVGDVPRVFDRVNNEPTGSIEMSLAADPVREFVYLNTSAPDYLSSGRAGIYAVDVNTGVTTYSPYPRELTNPIHQTFTVSAYDHVNDYLLMGANATERTWGKRLLTARHELGWLGAINEWVTIPNSQMLPLATGRPQPTHMTKLGYGSIVTGDEPMPFMNANKNGITPTKSDGTPANLNGRTWNQLKLNYGGVANDSGRFNSRPANIVVDWGDSGWLDNSSWRFVHGVSNPYWELAITGCHKSLYKNNAPAPGYEQNMQPQDNTKAWLNLDGSCRGGHQYWNNYVVSRYDWKFCAGHNQMAPTDDGSFPNVTLGDLTKRQWIAEELVAAPIHTKGVSEPFRCQDSSTEDIYFFQGEWFDIWRAATNTWTYFRARNDGYTIDDATGAYNYTDGYLLYCYRDASIAGDPAVVNKNHWSIFTGAAIVEITAHSGPYASIASYVTGDAPIGSHPRVCGMQWIPPWGKFAFFRDDGYIYTVERSGTTLIWDRLVTTGTAPVVSSSFARNGSPQSVYTNFWYVDNPSLTEKYITWSEHDLQPMRAIRVA